jgi:hypothetical protein
MHGSTKSGVILQIFPDFYFIYYFQDFGVRPETRMNC